MWKEEAEKLLVTMFLKKSLKKSKVCEQQLTEHFYCNRSGNYQECSSRKRQLKSQGSSKINNVCTSSLKVKRNSDGSVTVDLCSTHYGHEEQLCHIRIQRPERQQIARSLIQGVPPKKILNTIYNDYVPKLERKHLIERKDILNIAAAYGVEKIQRHSEDHLSVDAYVSELIPQNTIILYKRQHDEHVFHPKGLISPLLLTDFALGIMTTFQKETLKRFGNDIICMDSTHGTNGYNFNLITIMVIDDYGEGIPVAWFVCNREDGEVLTLFFTQVKAIIGNLFSRVIMTDKAPQFYNSWVQVFEFDSQKLLCYWHVDQDWQKQLRKIGNIVMRSDVYKALAVLSKEPHEDKFEGLLCGCLNDFQDNEQTVEFGNYFAKEWVPVKHQWATCYRMNSGINTNGYSEAFHRTLKVNGFQNKYNKRLDKCIVTLLEKAQSYAIDCIKKQEKGKCTKKSTETAKNHSKALKLSLSLVKEICPGQWQVTSAKSTTDSTTLSEGLIYTVKINLQPRCHNKCHITCKDCNKCIHMLSCTCPSGVYNTRYCKHMHLVTIFTKENNLKMREERENYDNPSTVDSINPYFEESVPETTETSNITQKADAQLKENIIRELNFGKTSHDDLQIKQQKFIRKLALLLSKIEPCKDISILNNVDCHINAAVSVLGLSSLTGLNTEYPFPTTPNVPHNKLHEKQRRFHSTKRPRKKNNVKYAKPDFEERILIRQHLLEPEKLCPNTLEIEHNYTIKNNFKYDAQTATVSAYQYLKGSEQRNLRDCISCFVSSESKIDMALRGIQKIEEYDIETMPENVDDSVINFSEQNYASYFTTEAWLIIQQILSMKRKLWSCGLCSEVSTEKNMVQCDNSLCCKWYHWKCVNIIDDPSNNKWFCCVV